MASDLQIQLKTKAKKIVRFTLAADESTDRTDTAQLSILIMTWCSHNNLELNVLKTVEIVVDFRKNAAPPASITLHHPG